MQGSYWGPGGFAFGSATSAIDEILEKEEFTLEELLDHDDILQECKYRNEVLIEFISTPEVVEQLVKYVVKRPPTDDEKKEEDDEKVKRKAEREKLRHEQGQEQDDDEDAEEEAEKRYPYLASELFACEIDSMTEVFFQKPELLDLLFSFLDQKPPLSPGDAAYFLKVVDVLLHTKHIPFVAYLKQHDIVDKIVNHISLYAFVGILSRIGWNDTSPTPQITLADVKWLIEKEDVIKKLVAKLDPVYDNCPEIQENASRALVDILTYAQEPPERAIPPSESKDPRPTYAEQQQTNNQTPPPSQPPIHPAARTMSPLVLEMQRPSVLSLLFKHMLGGSTSSLNQSLPILSALITRTITPPPGVASKTEDHHESKAADAKELEPEKERALSRAVLNDQTLDMVLKFLPELVAFLVNPPNQSTLLTPIAFSCAQGAIKPPLGLTRLRLVQVIESLVRVSQKRSYDMIAKVNVIPLVLDIFFKYTWNNMLHSIVESILHGILGSDSDILKKTLFEDGKILERVMTGWVGIDHLKYRVGNMGHLIRIANAIVLAGSDDTPSAKSGTSPVKAAHKADPYVKEQIGKAGAAWSNFVTGSLAQDVERQTIVPGGKPSQRPGQPPPPPQQEEQHQQESFDFDTFEFTTDTDFDGDIIEIGVNEPEDSNLSSGGTFYLGDDHADDGSDEEDDDDFYNFNDSHGKNEGGAAGGKKKKKHGDKAHGHHGASAGGDSDGSKKESDSASEKAS